VVLPPKKVKKDPQDEDSKRGPLLFTSIAMCITIITDTTGDTDAARSLVRELCADYWDQQKDWLLDLRKLMRG